MTNINGTNGPDILPDTPGDDTIQAFGGDDTVTVTTGKDYADGSTGEDTIVIRYDNASQDITVLESGGTRAYVNSGLLGWEDSIRRIDFDRFEHLDVTTGSGNDDIHGVSNQSDQINGGAGVDLWRDSWAFMADPVALNLDMTLASSAGGQTLADKTTVRNIELVNVRLAGKDDRFSDHGNYDDYVDGNGGNDWFRTSGGRDLFDGDTGEDTVRIDWSDATQTVTIVEAGGTRGWVHTNGAGWESSTRRVDFERIEHLDVRSGSGDDDIHGVSGKRDQIDGGGGVDLWRDDFSALDKAVVIDMAAISSLAGQVLSDGSEIRNIETVALGLTAYDDQYKDFGSQNDRLNGRDGDDVFSTTGGQDSFDGDTGEDTVRIDWSDATQTVTIVEAGGTRGWVHTNGAGWESSTRRVDFERIEHLDVRSGSGDDDIHGVSGKRDQIDGGGGVDLWRDDFNPLGVGVKVNMAEASRSVGQVLADGSFIKNVERAQLGLSAQGDKFFDSGVGDDVVNGRAGNDVFGTKGGRDYFDGSIGEDTVRIAWKSSNDNIFVVESGGTRAWVENGGGWSGAETRVDFDRVEHLIVQGGSGDDDIHGVSRSWDRIDGGNGIDLWRDNLSDLDAGIKINMSKMASKKGQKLSDGTTIKNTEAASLTLTDGDDKFLDFGRNDDRIVSGAGNDTFVSRGGRDVFDAGTGGFDTLILKWGKADGVVIVDSSRAYVDNGTLGFGDSDWRVEYSSVERLVASGGASADTLSGTTGADKFKAGAGADRLLGRDGNDRLKGQDGKDELLGGNGDDRLWGGNQVDKLFGDAGQDLLDGGKGNDELTGGAGADTFVLATRRGVDRITDFESGIDKIGLGRGLKYSDLEIVGRGQDTLIKLETSDARFVWLEGIDALTIGEADFLVL